MWLHSASKEGSVDAHEAENWCLCKRAVLFTCFFVYLFFFFCSVLLASLPVSTSCGEAGGGLRDRSSGALTATTQRPCPIGRLNSPFVCLLCRFAVILRFPSQPAKHVNSLQVCLLSL